MAKKEKKVLDNEVRMVAAIAEALSFKRANPASDEEKIIKHIAKFVVQEKTKETKMAMIAATSKALKLLERDNFLSDRAIISKVVPDLNNILDNIDLEA